MGLDVVVVMTVVRGATTVLGQSCCLVWMMQLAQPVLTLTALMLFLRHMRATKAWVTPELAQLMANVVDQATAAVRLAIVSQLRHLHARQRQKVGLQSFCVVMPFALHSKLKEVALQMTYTFGNAQKVQVIIQVATFQILTFHL